MTRVAGKYESLAIARHERDLDLARQPGGHPRGLWFDAAAAQRVIKFVEGFCRHYEGEWAGQRVALEGWQKRHLLEPIFGWKRADGTRRYRTAYIEIARKNGKSFLCSALGNYLLIADGEPGAQVYSSATKEEQAAIVWRGSATMVKKSPDLKRFVKVFGERKKTGGSLLCERTGSFFRPLGADSETQDGLNPHGNIIDELHAHKDDGMWNVLKTAMGARRQPLTLAITTAGTYDITTIGWKQHEYACNVLDGVFDDDSFFAFIAAADEGDDYFSPIAQMKANPNYGISVKPDYLAEQAMLAQRSSSFYNEYLRLHLNVWSQQATRWLSQERWRECDALDGTAALAAREERERLLLGRRCYAAADLSSKLDLTALVLAFPDDAGAFDLICRFWLPEATIAAEAKKGRKHYEQWAREGWLTPTPGEVIDYGFIRREVNELSSKYFIEELAYDQHNATQLATELAEQDGLTMVEHSQGILAMSEPSKAFEAAIVDRKVRHGGNPVLRWMVGNAVVKVDANGNIKPDKARATGKIDGVVAAIMAMGRANLNASSSIYSATRGLLSL